MTPTKQKLDARTQELLQRVNFLEVNRQRMKSALETIKGATCQTNLYEIAKNALSEVKI